MTEYRLKDRFILVVEDEYIIAARLAEELSTAGAIVIGPAGTLNKTISLIKEVPAIEAAVLDVNLRGEMVYPAADMLMTLNIPFIFMTGYDPSAIPQRFKEIIKFGKSGRVEEIVKALDAVMLGNR